ncbi:MAG: ABC-F family ATP-binding cassette domain-containing protein [Chloroflexota bacterium]
MPATSHPPTYSHHPPFLIFRFPNDIRMSLLTVSNLAKAFGPEDIFSGVTFAIPKGARAAIVGPNGVGKTTLLRILIEEETASAGSIVRAKGLKTGYLPQEAASDASFGTGATLWQACLEAFNDLRQMEAELATLEAQMSDPTRAEAALERYGALQATFEHRGGYTYITQVQQVLTGLGFGRDELELPLRHLSGGQRTRALLARLLLLSPDLLVLDEPTNHLDIAAVEWLEDYLNHWDGAALIVSHDRYFLDRVANVVFEMNRAGFESYHGNYSAYVTDRQRRWDHRQEVFESEKERLVKDVEYIKKNISGQNVQQAKGRLKRLTRILQAIEQLGMDKVVGRNWGEVSGDVNTTVSPFSVEEAERRVRSLRPPVNRPPGLSLHLHATYRSGDIVLRTYDLAVGFPDRTLFRTENIELRRLETAALIGPNGAGKTTFLKTILDQHPPLKGEVELGASLKVGYFAQAHEDLRRERTLVEEIDSVAPNMLLADIRDYLAKFLFSGEDVFKKVDMLSGGEGSRLALAKLSLSGANLLLLDEPTNHLDIPSQEILQEVLDRFQGTILLVSHDRYLIDALATQIWEIDEAQGVLHVFKGTYSEYRAIQEAQREQAKAATLEAGSKTVQAPKGGSSRTNEERRRRNRLSAVEKEIAELENEIARLARALENPPTDPGRVQQMGNDYMRRQSELDEKMTEWESLQNQIGS